MYLLTYLLTNIFLLFVAVNREFDKCIDHRDAYKLATIGDAYLVASGLPHETSDHSRQVCLLGLDILYHVWTSLSTSRNRGPSAGGELRWLYLHQPYHLGG